LRQTYLSVRVRVRVGVRVRLGLGDKVNISLTKRKQGNANDCAKERAIDYNKHSCIVVFGFLRRFVGSQSDAEHDVKRDYPPFFRSNYKNWDP
jgi:hypothetical protein